MGRQQYYPRPVMRGAGRRGRRPGRRVTFLRSVASAAKKTRLGYSGARPHIGYKAGGSLQRRDCLMGRHPEKKFLDLGHNGTPSVTGITSIMSIIAQGADESERIGRKTIITDILYKGHFAWGSTTGTAPLTANRVRMLVVQDTQPNKAVFAITDVMETADINSYRNLAQAKRFNILFDRVYTRSGSAGHGDGTANDFGTYWFPFNVNIKCCIDMEYSGADGAIDKQTINSVHLLFFSETASPAVTVVGNSRIRFVE